MFKFMSHLKFLVVLLAFMLLAAVAIFGSGCSLFGGSGDTAAKLQTINKTLVNAVVLAYQSGGNQLAYTQIDKMVADGKVTPEQAVTLKSALDNGIASLQAAANSPDTTTTIPAAAATTAPPVSTGP
ncbi:MAG: hypothetical protein ACYC4Q_08395 [Victivallaceae bacterium]